MVHAHRPAQLDDAAALLDVRQRSILELAAMGLPAGEAEAWAARSSSSPGCRGNCAISRFGLSKLMALWPDGAPFAAIFWRGFIRLPNLPGTAWRPPC